MDTLASRNMKNNQYFICGSEVVW